METIEINEIKINIEKRHIKNLNLYVKPPNGDVFVSAPHNLSNENIRAFLVSKIPWIRKQQLKYQTQERQTKREYVTGESIYVWGRRYNLDVVYSNKENGISFIANKMILQVREASTAEQRENYLNEWYREQLKKAIPAIAEKYEGIMGVHANEWKTKNMRTRWGTCNVKAKRIWLNLQLAKKNPQCLEYVVVHELCHLLEKSHNAVFKAYMDKYYPNWRVVKDELNYKYNVDV